MKDDINKPLKFLAEAAQFSEFGVLPEESQKKSRKLDPNTDDLLLASWNDFELAEVKLNGSILKDL